MFIWGIPFNYIMTFVVGLGINGMLLSQIINLSVFYMVTSLTVRRIDYKKECELAAKRIEDERANMRKLDKENAEREAQENSLLVGKSDNEDG